MAMGLMVLVACPGGISSGLFTHLARGDVALSVSLTAVTSVATVFTLMILLGAWVLSANSARWHAIALPW